MEALKSSSEHAGEELKLPGSPQDPRRVGRYLLCDQIGSGGMATIHLGRLLGSQGFSRTVAIKQLHPQYAQNPQFAAMLLDEARLAVRVRHVNVISTLDIVATGSELFIVMDYVNGESFANLLLAAEGPLRPPLAAAILSQVLMGLHAAHEATREQGEALGLVHRDVSPQNILVGQDGVARVLDFGIAKAVARTQTTDGGMVKGKLGYLAPEQIRLHAVDRRTDLFGAGVVLWEALTGEGLFTADSLGASIDQLLHAPIHPPSRSNPAVTPELDAVVLKALARDPKLRFQDAMSMAAALQAATPLASALEIIGWVEKLAGPELERKADIVRRAEALSWEPNSMKPALAEATETPAFAPAPTTSTHLSGLSVVATGESTGVAVGGDRDASMPIASQPRSGWRSLAIGLGVVLAGATVAVLVLSLSWGDREASLDVARQPLGAQPRLGVALDAPAEAPAADAPAVEARAAEAPTDPQALAPLPGSPRVRPVHDEPAPQPAEPSEQSGWETNERAPAPSRAARAASRASGKGSERASTPARRSARAAASGSGADVASAGASSPPRPSEKEGAGSTSPSGRKDRCKPPWVIDEHQIKVFKAECLR